MNETNRGRRVVAMILLGVIAAGAVVLSFSGLTVLGELAGYGALSPIFAVVVDAGAAASTLYWLSGEVETRQGSWARGMAITLLVVSVLGNVIAHITLVLPWFVTAAVATVPPMVVAATVHLLALPAVRTPQADPLTPVGPPPDLGQTLDPDPDPAEVQASQLAARNADDEALVAEIVDWSVREDGMPSRERVRTRFGIGSKRAARLRDEAVSFVEGSGPAPVSGGGS